MPFIYPFLFLSGLWKSYPSFTALLLSLLLQGSHVWLESDPSHSWNLMVLTTDISPMALNYRLVTGITVIWMPIHNGEKKVISLHSELDQWPLCLQNQRRPNSAQGGDRQDKTARVFLLSKNAPPPCWGPALPFSRLSIYNQDPEVAPEINTVPENTWDGQEGYWWGGRRRSEMTGGWEWWGWSVHQWHPPLRPLHRQGDITVGFNENNEGHWTLSKVPLLSQGGGYESWKVRAGTMPQMSRTRNKVLKIRPGIGHSFSPQEWVKGSWEC